MTANRREWQLCRSELDDDQCLAAEALDVHRTLLEGPLGQDPMLNLALPVQERARRRIEDWRVLLLLTPWMLARLLFPDRAPALALPNGWGADERAGTDYVVLGPRVTLELLGRPQQAHLSYHPRLGHYLLQPICLDMSPYKDADSVFERWSEVIRVRDENMEKAARDCPMQKEISRRELFRRLKPGG